MIREPVITVITVLAVVVAVIAVAAWTAGAVYRRRHPADPRWLATWQSDRDDDMGSPRIDDEGDDDR